MDPVSMIVAFALNNPNITASAIEDYQRPGQIEVAKLEHSLADFATQTVKCYHKSARFRGVQVVGTPWTEQSKFGADQSVILRIHLQGISGTGYQMVIAAMAKGNNYRTFVIDENTLVPYNKNCSLESWTLVEINH